MYVHVHVHVHVHVTCHVHLHVLHLTVHAPGCTAGNSAAKGHVGAAGSSLPRRSAKRVLSAAERASRPPCDDCGVTGAASVGAGSCRSAAVRGVAFSASRSSATKPRRKQKPTRTAEVAGSGAGSTQGHPSRPSSGDGSHELRPSPWWHPCSVITQNFKSQDGARVGMKMEPHTRHCLKRTRRPTSLGYLWASLRAQWLGVRLSLYTIVFFIKRAGYTFVNERTGRPTSHCLQALYL